jgi:hypothetical protein
MATRNNPGDFDTMAYPEEGSIEDKIPPCDEFECIIERLKSLGLAAVYSTQIQYGGPDAAWHDDADLLIVLKNRNNVIPACKFPDTGTTVSWYSEKGNGSITFYGEKEFRGTAQFPGEGPVGYRGVLK